MYLAGEASASNTKILVSSGATEGRTAADALRDDLGAAIGRDGNTEKTGLKSVGDFVSDSGGDGKGLGGGVTREWMSI
jgi:hypothetical protein